MFKQQTNKLRTIKDNGAIPTAISNYSTINDHSKCVRINDSILTLAIPKLVKIRFNSKADQGILE